MSTEKSIHTKFKNYIDFKLKNNWLFNLKVKRILKKKISYYDIYIKQVLKDLTYKGLVKLCFDKKGELEGYDLTEKGLNFVIQNKSYEELYNDNCNKKAMRRISRTSVGVAIFGIIVLFFANYDKIEKTFLLLKNIF